jgi:ADP-L-glycero-D-manno-heptose 6-epimerase
MNKNLLVTGIDGFIGSNFALQARINNFKVFGLSRPSTNWDAKQYEKNLIDISQNNEFESVIHFGAIASTRLIDREALYGFNVEAVKIISNFCSSTNTPLVFISSSAIYGNASNNLSLYAETKKHGESIIHNTPNLRFLILRLFNTYGFNEIAKNDMKSLISEMIITGLKNKKISIWEFSDLRLGSQSRDFIYVQDVISIILTLILSERYFHETLDLGSGGSYKFIDIANYIASIESDLLIELVSPPNNYEEKFYQQYTCANISWMKQVDGLRLPRHPFEIIPELIKRYELLIK